MLFSGLGTWCLSSGSTAINLEEVMLCWLLHPRVPAAHTATQIRELNQLEVSLAQIHPQADRSPTLLGLCSHTRDRAHRSNRVGCKGETVLQCGLLLQVSLSGATYLYCTACPLPDGSERAGALHSCERKCSSPRGESGWTV